MEPYIGEIRLFAGNFAPVNWLPCNGQMLSSQGEYSQLFSVIQHTYTPQNQINGGTFMLPNLQGQILIGTGTYINAQENPVTYNLNATGGVESVTLSVAELPTHNHAFRVCNAYGTVVEPGPSLMLANSPSQAPMYIPVSYGSHRQFASGIIGPGGGGQPHENRMPSLVLTYIICYYGNYPSED